MKISPSLVRLSLLFLLLTMTTAAFGADLISVTALPQQHAQAELREGVVTVRELMPGEAVVSPDAGCSEVEPNESTSEANPFALPGTCTGAAAASDPGDFIVTYSGGATDDVEDLWRITLGSSGTVTATTTFTSSGDIDIFLFRVSGSSVTPLANSSKVNTTSETFTMPLTAGTYYIGVSAYTGSSTYTLDVSATGQGTVTVNAPSNLQAEATSSSVIHLTWSDNSTNEDEFRVEQKNSVDAWVDIGGVAANSTGVNVSGFSAGQTGTFRVRARAGSTYSGYSNQASATTSGGGLLCFPDATTVCLLSDRFRVKIDYVNPFSNPPNQPGTFLAARLLQGVQNPDTALFGFNSAQAVEVLVRIQDTRPFAPRFDIYYGGMTDVGYTVTVTDTQTGTTRQYTNTAGHVGGGVDRTSFPAN
ncbi:MAG: fibronectin type III domain-containing protein [Thermoanaerobaculia bacterium]